LVASVWLSSKAAGTVMTAASISSWVYWRTSSRSDLSTSADSSSGSIRRPVRAKVAAWPVVPIRSLNSDAVLSGSDSIRCLARRPTRSRSDLLMWTAEGVTSPPSLFLTISASMPRITATALLVVPRSIP
jgi:hypothetical protein